MRVEPAKNNQADKKDVSNFKPEKPVFDSTSSTKTADVAAVLPAKGAFEKILTETRQQSSREKEKSLKGSATAANESAAETTESDEEKEVQRRAEQKTESKEKNKDGGKGGEHANDDENSTGFTASLLTNESKSNAPAAPAARQILHVADLERIVSFIRTQNSGDASQILISLKHTVLEGLQIRLTLNQNGNLKAEFLALNQQIKKQLKQRERELLGILKQRSARFTEIDILMI